MTPDQKKHARKAEALLEQSAKRIEQTKTGRSGAAAERILEANKERKKAGLIKGPLIR